MKLSDAKISEKLKIISIGGSVKSRLYDMGLKVGSEITVIAVAPLKTPICVKSGNTRLSIARSAAEIITVEYVG